MAGPVKQARDNRPISKRYRHVRRAISLARRRESSSRRLPVEWGEYRSSPRSIPQQRMQPPPEQAVPVAITVPYGRASSLDTALQHTGSIRMERTSSGSSIISDASFEPRHNYTFTRCDAEAAHRVEMHFKSLPPHDQHAMQLRNLIRYLIKNPFPVEDEVLHKILKLADSVFFGGVLFGRVRWEWSNPSQPRFETELIGTTALREAAQGGYETLIVLSEPILKHPDYDRRLLLSAFLHELVHCYLFIQCGFTARSHGGHTDGFHAIVGIIDKWAGSGYLRLCEMKANLNHFLNDRGRVIDVKLGTLRGHRHDGCNQSPGPQGEYLETAGFNPGWV